MENNNQEIKKPRKRKKVKKWIRFRHTVVRNVLYLPFYLYCRIVYRIKLEKYKGDKNQPHFILFNHQTGFDQFFVSMCFPKHVYYVSSEDLFSKAWLSKALSYLVAPIPFRKSTSDIAAIKNCMRIAREGGSIGMAPEGNRTYSGTTEHMKPAVASLAKALKLPLAIYRIEGGYGVMPRFADKVRKGRMRGYFSRIIPYDEIKAMSDDELFSLIQRELYVDEREDKTLFYSKHSAEYLDRAMYYCHNCGFSRFFSKGDIISCQKCGEKIRYMPNKRLEGVGFDFPYPYVKEWYDAQCDFVRRSDLSPYVDTPVFEDSVSFRENVYCKKKIMIDKNARLSVYADRLTVATKNGEYVFPFAELSSATVLGKNKLNVYTKETTYQFKGDKHFNALKYLNLYCHATNTVENGKEPQFLGL